MDMEAETSGQPVEFPGRRRERFDVQHHVDIHCHCLPGIDDGPATMGEAVALCRMLVDDGIATAIATPHQLGRYDLRNSGTKIRQVVEALSTELLKERIPLEVHPGADVRVDERIPNLLDQGEVLTLADGDQYLLLELPHELVVDPRPLLETLSWRGVQTIISHPERHQVLQQSPHLLRAWLADGAVFQVTASSLTGSFGPGARDTAWSMIRHGLVSLVATDAHGSEYRRPHLSAAFGAISKAVGPDIARRLCITNPQRILDGEPIEAI